MSTATRSWPATDAEAPRVRIGSAESCTYSVNEIPDIVTVTQDSHDVTELREAEDHLEHERLYDHLTGFPTRGLFIEHLKRALLRSARPGSTLAVFGVDINGLGIRFAYAGLDGEKVKAMLGLTGARVYGFDTDYLHKVAQTINAPTLEQINHPLEQVPENAGMWAFRTVGAFA